MSCSNTTPLNAPTSIGVPHSTIAAHAGSAGSPRSTPVMLSISDTTDMPTHTRVTFGSFSSHFFISDSSLPFSFETDKLSIGIVLFV